ncbi:MAG: hypothetical protein LAN63_05930 [Acidobacteriia bacterium]|nr:hypothetical protein [Terriglobia bacterium]
MTSELRSLQLPSTLCERAEQRFGARFGSVEQLLTFVLQELLRDDAAQMDQAEQRIVEQRLKDLGYI